MFAYNSNYSENFDFQLIVFLVERVDYIDPESWTFPMKFALNINGKNNSTFVKIIEYLLDHFKDACRTKSNCCMILR